MIKLPFFRRKQALAVKKVNPKLPAHLKVGTVGENAACHFYITRGFTILHRNIKIGDGELDIVAENKEFVIFCEVKARIASYGVPSPYGRPAAAVTKEKRRHLIQAASFFERKYRNKEKRFRFDVIEVYLTPDLEVEHIHHIRNAFSAHG
jgi:putative endonuclease